MVLYPNLDMPPLQLPVAISMTTHARLLGRYREGHFSISGFWGERMISPVTLVKDKTDVSETVPDTHVNACLSIDPCAGLTTRLRPVQIMALYGNIVAELAFFGSLAVVLVTSSTCEFSPST